MIDAQEIVYVDDIANYVARVADYFTARPGVALVEIYKLGSLAHGGFSHEYSDIDVGIILNCPTPPVEMDELIAGAKTLDAKYGNKLSVFWGNPLFSWGRLPILDRLDLLDHGVPLVNDRKANFPRPSKGEIRFALRDSIEKSWRPRFPGLQKLPQLEAAYRKPYIRCLLYPARLIYTWDCLEVNSNDRAVEYLRRVQPPNLDLQPIEMALACRHGGCDAEEVFALGTDLDRQCGATLSYIAATAQ
jgi:predicted nucleotidyltransferase